MHTINAKKKKKRIDTSLGYLVAGYHHCKLIYKVVTQRRNYLTHFSVFKFCKLITQNIILNEQIAPFTLSLLI